MSLLAKCLWLCRRFRGDNRGQIAIIFALASVAIFAGLGAGIDLARAYAARQKLSQVATLACQYSTRPSVAQTATANYSGANGFQTYVNAINAFATSSLGNQNWGTTPTTGGSGSAGQYFTATPAVGGSTAAANSPTNPVVEMSANVPTTFGQILNITQVTVHAKIACSTLANAPQVVNAPVLLKEGFETACSSYCFTNPTGGTALSATPTSSFPATAGYVGYNGFKWYIIGYCLEVDTVGVINPTVPEGTHAAELDCDNGSGSAGNSSISSSLYLETGQYELRYNYRSRIGYVNYNPAYVCGSTAGDVAWANDGNVLPWKATSVQRTNQINVYLDANLAGTNGTVGSAPLHKTIDNTQYLAGSNLIDSCVYTPTWIERSVRVKVTSPGIYWLSFAADGVSDSYGGQVDNIRFCQELCPGALQDNFPPSWLAANNGGVNKLLFEDTFDLPIYSPTIASYSLAGNLNNSVISNTGCGVMYLSPPGWPCQNALPWATAPYNEVVVGLQGAAQGLQYIQIDGYNGYSSGSGSTNRLISRPFLFDPGYYQLQYNYLSGAQFTDSSPFTLDANNAQCRSAPASGFIFANSIPGKAAAVRYYGSVTTDATTNIVGVYMSHSALISTPITGASMGGATSYANPDGTTTTTPAIAPDAVSWSNYNAAVVNPVLDMCVYSKGASNWQARSVYFKITKPGFYWLSFSANGGAADDFGGGIDDVKLTAIGSPYLASPPTTPLVAIPVPSPQADAAYLPTSTGGFSIVASPFTPPGADQ